MLVRPRRFVAASAVALLSACGHSAPSTAVAPVNRPFEYAASTGQYRITTKTKGSQEAMGQKTDFESTNSQLLSVTVTRPSKDTATVTIVIDSVTAVGPMAAPGFERLRGAKVTAVTSPTGIVYTTSGPAEGTVPNASQVTDDLGRFLPRIRQNVLSAGASWMDTTSGKVKQAGVDVERKTIAKYTVLGDTVVGATKTWKIARETSSSLTGSGAMQGQPITLQGTSTGHGTILVNPNGVFAGSESADQANVKIVLTANGVEIGVTTTANTKVEKVK